MKLITIAEYAEQNSISPQAVYKRINKGQLKSVKQKDESGKYIKYIVIETAENRESEFKPEFKPPVEPTPAPLSTDLNHLNQPINQPVEKPLNQGNAGNSEIIDLLISQLSEKDRQIERLQAQIEQQTQDNREKDKVIQEQMLKLNELLTNSQQLQAQANVLLLDKKPEEPIEITETDKPETKKKVSFWKRIFGND